MKNLNKSINLKGKLRAALMILLLGVIIASMLFAQENLKTESIKTSAQCDMCKARIEKHLLKQDGLSEANLEVETAVCEVKFDSTKITLDDIRKEIASIGYDADDVKAIKRAYDKLPKCCKKPEDR